MKRRFIVEELYVGDAVLTVQQTVKVGLTKVGNEANPLKYSEEKLLKITFLFSEFGNCFSSFPTSVRPSMTVRGAARTQFVATNLCLDPSVTSRNLGMEVFCLYFHKPNGWVNM